MNNLIKLIFIVSIGLIWTSQAHAATAYAAYCPEQSKVVGGGWTGDYDTAKKYAKNHNTATGHNAYVTSNNKALMNEITIPHLSDATPDEAQKKMLSSETSDKMEKAGNWYTIDRSNPQKWNIVFTKMFRIRVHSSCNFAPYIDLNVSPSNSLGLRPNQWVHILVNGSWSRATDLDRC